MNRFSLVSSPPIGSTAALRAQKAASISHPPSSNPSSLFDPHSTQVDAHLGDYLMHQMIASISDSTAHSLRRTISAKKKYHDQIKVNLGSGAHSNVASNQTSDLSGEPLAADVDEAYRMRMDAAGYKVGWVLAERLTKDKPRFPRANQQNPTMTTPDPLEVIKFVCKDIWMAMYNKQANNLRTNHRGIYVIQDHSYRPFLRISAPVGYESEMDIVCRKMLAFPLAVIRGALMNLGVQCIVSAEIAIPQCTFQIRTAVTSHPPGSIPPGSNAPGINPPGSNNPFISSSTNKPS